MVSTNLALMAVPQLRPRPQPPACKNAPQEAEPGPTAGGGRVDFPVTRFEQVLLILALISLPFENRINAPVSLPILGAPSVTWLAFAALGLFIVIRHPWALAKVARHRATVPVYAFLAVTLLMELTRAGPSFNYWWRTVQMVIGALFVAATCRNRATVRVAAFSLVCVGLGLATLLIATTYSPLRHTRANTFTEVSAIRNDLLNQSFQAAEINNSAFLVAEGAAMAFALGLTTRTHRVRSAYVAVGLTCFFGVFLSLSRGGVGVAVAAVSLVLVKSGRNKPVVALRILAVAVVAAAVIPHSVYARLQLSPDLNGRTDPRVQVYDNATKYLPEYVVFGVGAGTFESHWALDHGFVKGRSVLNSHNTFVQITIYWGLPGLLALLCVALAMWKALPPDWVDPATSIVLKALAMSLLILLFVSDTVYGKEVSVTVGLLLGSRIWLVGRPRTTARPAPTHSTEVRSRGVAVSPA